MKNFIYPAKLAPDQGSLSVQFRDLPEAITFGADRTDAVAQATDCLEEAIAARITDGLDIPEPSTPRRADVMISLPAPLAAKTALYLAIRETGLSNSAVARKLRMDEKEIRRMLDPRHATRLNRIQDILTELGKRLVVSLDNAA